MNSDTVVALIDRRISLVRRALASAPSGRGGRALEYSDYKLTQISVNLDDIRKSLDVQKTSDELAAKVLAQATDGQLAVLTEDLDRVAAFVATYRDSVGKDDVPVGLSDLIYGVIGELLERPHMQLSVDPLIHLAATSHCEVEAVGISENKMTFEPPLPIIFSLPALDAKNALLSPLIAHEAAHVVAALTPLPVVPEETNVEIKTLVAPLAAPPGTIATRITNWQEEVFCDLFAARICGPSFVAALIANVPALPGTSGTHPPTVARVRWALSYLSELGWSDFIRRHMPALDFLKGQDWAASMEEEEAALVEAMDLLLTITKTSVSNACDALSVPDPGAFKEAVSLLDASIPAVEVDVEGKPSPLEPWHAVCAGWAVALKDEAPTPPGVVSAAGQADISDLVLKTIELSRVVTLWGEA